MIPTRLPRHPTLADAMILVAALAGALAATRLATADLAWVLFQQPFFAVYLGTALVLPVLACLSLALLVIGLRPPRPRLRRLVLRPGMAACLASCLVLAVIAAWAGLWALAGRPPLGSSWTLYSQSGSGVSSRSVVLAAAWMPSFLTRFADRPGYAVAGAWLILVCAGRWRPDPNWIDRAGRLLGLGWILTSLLQLAGLWLV
jgi:hypothetical protein